MIPDETLQLLRAIYRGQREGYLTLTAIHPDKKQRTPSRHLHITDQAGIHQALTDLMQANRVGWGAYFSVALRKEPLGRWHRGGQSDLLTLTALYADLDGDLSESFERIRQCGLAGMPSASAMIGSGRGIHLFWRIQPTSDFEKVNRVLAGPAKNLGGDITHAHSAMRLPGSRNTKENVNRPCRLLWLAEDRHYTLSDFDAFAESPSLPHDRWRAPPSLCTGTLPPSLCTGTLPPSLCTGTLPPPTLRGDRPSDLPDQINPDLVEAVVNSLISDYGGFVQPNGWIGSLCPAGHAVDRAGKHFGYMESNSMSRGVKKLPHRSTSHEVKLPRVTLDYLAYGAKVGTRNNTLFAAACQFRDAGYTLADAEIILVQRYRADSQFDENPSAREYEARGTIRSAYTRAPRNPIYRRRTSL